MLYNHVFRQAEYLADESSLCFSVLLVEFSLYLTIIAIVPLVSTQWLSVLAEVRKNNHNH